LERWIPRGVATVLVGEGAPPTMRVLAAPSAPRDVVQVLDGTPIPTLARQELPHGLVMAPTGSGNPESPYDRAFTAAGLRCWWAAPMFASSGDAGLGGF